MTSYFKLLLSCVLIIFNNVLGHFLPPFSIFFTPFVLGTTTYLLSSSSFEFPTRVLLIISTIISNDILIKLFAGGIHDVEGAGWINLFFFFGVTASTIIAVVMSYQSDRSLLKCLFSLTIPALLFWYIEYFSFFGTSYAVPRSESSKISKENGLFVGELVSTEKKVYFRDDSLIIINGWVEKQQYVDHTGFIKKVDPNRAFNFIINIKTNKQPYGSNLMYMVNNEEHNVRNSIGPIIEFSSLKLSSSLLFYSSDQADKDSVIDEIKLMIK